MKNINDIIVAQRVNMGGNWLYQPLPTVGLDSIDPILLIHHWKDALAGGKKQSEVGVPPHPHRGFSPVTVIYEGAIQHRDSLGTDSIVSEGGMQWMNSGSGIIHSERPTKEMAENGGELEFIQFWINSPASKKMEPAFYQPIEKTDMPVFLSEDKKVEVHVASGTYKEYGSPIKTTSDFITLKGKGEKNGTLQLTIAEKYNTVFYLLDGSVNVNGEDIGAMTMVSFEENGEEINLRFNSDAKFLVLAGVPIKEPIKTYGPFVMNSQQEIIQALNDFQSGKMGQLVEEFK